ncbi:hypothetical protein NPIL_613541 [Nephila pilipes]|uniref:Uncharacterized protein n=1 Tax=Nephila pilipes TaxID=299642 RepID=A0A8X6UH15_NEPPI|nr:hypothetical protein NPIL_613541 [Nephila pilipes]
MVKPCHSITEEFPLTTDAKSINGWLLDHSSPSDLMETSPVHLVPFLVCRLKEAPLWEHILNYPLLSRFHVPDNIPVHLHHFEGSQIFR